MSFTCGGADDRVVLPLVNYREVRPTFTGEKIVPSQVVRDNLYFREQ